MLNRTKRDDLEDIQWTGGQSWDVHYNIGQKEQKDIGHPLSWTRR